MISSVKPPTKINSEMAKNLIHWPELLRDEKGVYGYGFKNSSELNDLQDIVGPIPAPVILRDTAMEVHRPVPLPKLETYHSSRMSDASAEAGLLKFFIKLIAHTHGMSMERLKSGPSQKDSEEVQDKVIDLITDFSEFAVETLNVIAAQAYSKCIENELWNRSQDYPAKLRFKIVRFANTSKRHFQLLNSFPLLVLKIVMGPNTTGLSEENIKSAIELINSGSPLKDVAKVLKSSYSLRCLEPEVDERIVRISTRLYSIDETVQNLAHLYATDFVNWLEALHLALNVNTEYAAWIGREYRHFAGDRESKRDEIKYIGDWVRACSNDDEQTIGAGIRPFNMQMGYRSAIHASREWHDYIIQLQQVQDLLDPYGSYDSNDVRVYNFEKHASIWPANSTVDEIKIRRIASYEDLIKIAKLFRNCASSYVYEIHCGRCALYTFQEADEFLALLELRVNFGSFEIGQFLGPFNESPPKPARDALSSWKTKWCKRQQVSWDEIYSSPDWVRVDF